MMPISTTASSATSTSPRGAGRRREGPRRRLDSTSTSSPRSRSTAWKRRWARSARGFRGSRRALALGGILFAQGLQNYVMVWDWPMNFGGKPFAAWPAFVPITFEAMVFWAALGSALVAIVAGKKDTVPQPPPMLVTTGATVDRFVLWISATDPKWNAAEAERFVASLGADGVRLVDVDGGADA